MFYGSIVALVTPMQKNGVVDIEALRALIEWHIEQGTDAISVLGSTGESATLDYAERKLVIQQTLDQVKGRVPVIAGTGTNATQSTIYLTQEAKILGVDACLLVAPYYNKPLPEGLYQHFKTIAESVAIPQILYNVPSRTASDLTPAIVARLAAIANIVGIKEASGDITRISQTRALTDKPLDFFSGDDPTCLEFILAGGKGVISITSNVVPALMHQMTQTALAGEITQAQHINEKLKDLHLQLCLETNPIPVKWILSQMGKIADGIRLPLTWLSPMAQATIKKTTIQLGLIH